MNDIFDALEGAIALICGGFLFLLFASVLQGSSLQTNGLIDFSFWGVVYILVGVLGTITVIAAATGYLISEVA